jgi:hypothetical protein
MRHSTELFGRATRGPSAAATRSRRGFTLIEAAMVTVIIGVGVVGMLELLAAGTMSNTKGTELTTAINLANNVREITLGMQFVDPELPTTWGTQEGNVGAYDDIKDLDGCTFSPPLDVRRQPIASYVNWKQKIRVDTVDPNNVKLALGTKDPREVTARVTVTIEHAGADVYTMSWLAVAPKAN